MKTRRKIELLAPAKNLACGIEAINHGADAVYIGAPRYSARAAVGNSIEDIEALVRHAHLYNARVYVALNTILTDADLPDTQNLIYELYRVGVDAIIIQDMGILQMDLPPIPLHASTQTDLRTAEKVKFLADAGIRQVVLARELPLDEIRHIHEVVPNTALEVFVHGALCVSYSGQCYVSQACYGRSANRGECAQFCRLGFDLSDADGKVIARNKHFLSMRDMNRSADLEALMDAGVTSFKIEGRLKDITYVKNVTAYYHQKLEEIINRRSEYVRASSGKVQLSFTPQLDKSFSRGFTDYFLHGRTNDIYSFDTPKSLGEEVGVVKEIRQGYFTVAGVNTFSNGDGLCFIDEQGKLQGFRINKADGNKLYPQEMPRFRPKTVLYRNFSQEFERTMNRTTAERKLPIEMILAENNFGFTLSVKDDDHNLVSVTLEREKELARSDQTENIQAQLSKLGNTPFVIGTLKIDYCENWFIPSSELAGLRRKAIDELLRARYINYKRELVKIQQTYHSFPVEELTYKGNVSNHAAETFYRQHGVKQIAPAFELQPVKHTALMTCKHCIRYAMGWCPIHQRGKSPYREPYYLTSADGRRFRLLFDCKACEMKVIDE